MSPQLPHKPLTAEIAMICEGNCCMGAVKRTYQEMREQGQPVQFARDAAFRVFCWHHPEVASRQAEHIVSLWLHDGAVH